MAAKIDFMLAPPAVVLTELGERLAQARIQQNFTQDALAERSGVAVRTLRRFEAGQGGTTENLIRLLQALGQANALDVVLPRPGISPMRAVMMDRQAPAKRVRRRRAVKKTSPATTPWSWDEHETPA